MNRFNEVLEQDKKAYIKDWIITWEYQQKRRKAKKDYGSDIISDFSLFNGKEDLVKWMNWISFKHPDFIKNNQIKELIEKSRLTDERVIKNLQLNYNYQLYDTGIGINNAHDFYIPSILPSKNKIRNVLDFGAGYGRQANLWASPERIYLAIDAIPTSYCLQHLYFGQLGINFNDYIDNPTAFKFDVNQTGIYHLPSWRTDLIPPDSFDLALCVMVLPELNATLTKWIIGEFYRILKPGAMLYLRDHGQSVKLASSYDFDSHLLNHGFSLEYKPHVIDLVDIHGIPRIYRKNDPDVIKSQTKTTKQKVRETLRDIDYQTGGLLSKVSKQISSK